MPQDCLFCNIASKKMPSFVVYEDNNCIATLDINPANKGHLLVFPKKHYTSLMEIPVSEYNHLMHILRSLLPIIKKTTNAEGINVVYNLGEAAGQRLPHMFIHLIPRFKSDKHIYVQWQGKQIGKDITEQDMKKMQEKITSSAKNIKPPVMSVKKKEEKIILDKPKKKQKSENLPKMEKKIPKYW